MFARKTVGGMLITSDKLIPFSQLNRRWKGVSDETLVELGKWNLLIPYRLHTTFYNPISSMEENYLIPTSLFLIRDAYGAKVDYSFTDGVVYLEKHVLGFERAFSELLSEDDQENTRINIVFAGLTSVNARLETENTRLQSEIASLKAEKLELEKENASLKMELDGLKKEEQKTGIENYDAFFEAYPICGRIYELYAKGFTRGQIREELQKKTDYKLKEISFLTKDDLAYQSKDALKTSFYRSIKTVTGNK